MKQEKIKIRILKPFDSYCIGQEIDVLSSNGIPLDSKWRRRLADAKFDQCCEIIKNKRKEIKK